MIDIYCTPNGIYNLYLDLMTSRPFSIPDEKWQAPDDAMIQTFASLEEAKAALKHYGFSDEVRVVGTPKVVVKPKVQNAPTDEELNNYLTQKPTRAPTIPEGDRSEELVLLFKGMLSKNKKKKKDYINGMAKVILHLYPHLKSVLIGVVNGEEEEEDLL